MRLTKGSHYGTIELGQASSPQIIEDITPRTECSRRTESIFAHPLHRALMVLVIFVMLGLMTIVVDRISIPEVKGVTRQIVGQSSINKVGCVAEVGLAGSQLVMYHVTAPWQTLVVLQKWNVPLGISDSMQKSSDMRQLQKEVQNSFETYLKEAKVLAAGSVPYGSAKIMGDNKAFSPDVREALQRGISEAMQKAGFHYCDDWREGKCDQNAEKIDWQVLEGMDKDLKKWFSNSISRVDEWKESAKKHSEELKKEARDLKEKAKESLEKAEAKAKEEYEKAKENIQGSTQKLRETRNNGSRRRSERSVERTEKDLEKRLKHAEDEFDHMRRKAEKEFNELEHRAEEIMRRAEKEADEIERKAEAKLRRLKEKAEGMCKGKCKQPQAVPAPVPAPVPGVVPPAAAEPEKPKPKKQEKAPEKKGKASSSDDENDDDPKPVKTEGRDKTKSTLPASDGDVATAPEAQSDGQDVEDAPKRTTRAAAGLKIAFDDDNQQEEDEEAGGSFSGLKIRRFTGSRSRAQS